MKTLATIAQIVFIGLLLFLVSCSTDDAPKIAATPDRKALLIDKNWNRIKSIGVDGVEKTYTDDCIDFNLKADNSSLTLFTPPSGCVLQDRGYKWELSKEDSYLTIIRDENSVFAQGEILSLTPTLLELKYITPSGAVIYNTWEVK